MSEGVLIDARDVPSSRPRAAIAAGGAVRLRKMVADHLDFTWRCLRRLGLPEDVADDAAQRVFLVVSQKLDEIQEGCEKAFLFNTALRVASSERRSHARRREVLHGDDGPELASEGPAADELLDRQRARALLEDLMGELPMELRAVFVLFELEGLTMAEIAATMEVPEGTVASRLRRARQGFQAALKRHKARSAHPGGTR